jgi:hypothetical protein
MSLIPAWRVGNIRQPGNAAPSLHSRYKSFITTASSSAPRSGFEVLPHGFCHLSFPLIIQNEVLTFRTKACIEFMPPIHRLPLGS